MWCRNHGPKSSSVSLSLGLVILILHWTCILQCLRKYTIVEVAIVTFSRTRHTVEWSCSLLPGCQCCSLHPTTFHACNHYQYTYIQLLCSGSVKGWAYWKVKWGFFRMQLEGHAVIHPSCNTLKNICACNKMFGSEYLLSFSWCPYIGFPSWTSTWEKLVSHVIFNSLLDHVSVSFVNLAMIFVQVF